jgi:hypothetical protein
MYKNGTRELNEKKTLDLYNISKYQSSKLGSPKNKRARNLTNYIK